MDCVSLMLYIPFLTKLLARGDKLNASGRTLNGRFVAMNIDSPGLDGNYGASRLRITGAYLGPGGSKAIDPNGFDVEILPNNRLRFWMANVRPPVDAVSGEYLDAAVVGANGTVESFELIRGEDTMKWTGTFGANSGMVHSPNKVAADLNGGFVVTNDHGANAPSRFGPHFLSFTTPSKCMPLMVRHRWSGMKLPNIETHFSVSDILLTI
jgi:hypothetical protein